MLRPPWSMDEYYFVIFLRTSSTSLCAKPLGAVRLSFLQRH